jgi:acyl-CoA thioesterase-1
MSNALQIRRAVNWLRWLPLAGVLLAAAPARAAPPPTVVLLGDSVTAFYGLRAADALPVQLQGALARLGSPARVQAAGVSGDTTADGLARVDFSVPAGTDLCLVELGGNDLLQGVDPAAVRRNLDQIVRKLKARGVRAAIVGVRAPPAAGAGYARDFDAAFAAAAKDTGVPLFADWLGVVVPALRQPDGLHPNPQGARVLAASLAPFVVRSLKSGK